MILLSSIRKEPVEGFPHYWAGYDGLIYRDECIISGRYLPRKVFNLNPISYNYLSITLRSNDRILTTPVHRVICTSYHPNPYDLPIINHRDTDIQNNKPKNLEWCTYSWNTKWYSILHDRKIEKLVIGAPYYVKRIKKVLTLVSKEARYLLMSDSQYYFIEEIQLP